MSYDLIKSERGGIIVQKGKPKIIEAASMSRKKEIQMKGNIKKFAIFVTIAAIAMFSTAAMAWDNHNWYTPIYGKYAVTGSGNCVPSSGGVNFFTLIQIWEGEYTFDGNGSGSFKGSFRAVNLSDNSLSKADVSWEFNYEMTGHNRFETYLKPGTYDKVSDPAGIQPDNYFDIVGRFSGAVEQNGASIVITSGPPEVIHYLCTSTDPPSKQNPCVYSIEALCSESLVGLRVR